MRTKRRYASVLENHAIGLPERILEKVSGQERRHHDPRRRARRRQPAFHQPVPGRLLQDARADAAGADRPVVRPEGGVRLARSAVDRRPAARPAVMGRLARLHRSPCGRHRAGARPGAADRAGDGDGRRAVPRRCRRGRRAHRLPGRSAGPAAAGDRRLRHDAEILRHRHPRQFRRADAAA